MPKDSYQEALSALMEAALKVDAAVWKAGRVFEDAMHDMRRAAVDYAREHRKLVEPVRMLEQLVSGDLDMQERKLREFKIDSATDRGVSQFVSEGIGAAFREAYLANTPTTPAVPVCMGYSDLEGMECEDAPLPGTSLCAHCTIDHGYGK